MGHSTGEPYYTLNFLWTLSYPSQSWIARRTLLCGIVWAAGLATIYLGGFGIVSWVGWMVTLFGVMYGLYLAEVGYRNTRKLRKAQGLPLDE